MQMSKCGVTTCSEMCAARAAADWAFLRQSPPRGKVDRADWTMTPQTNNAYNGNLRDIVSSSGHSTAADIRSGCRPRR